MKSNVINAVIFITSLAPLAATAGAFSISPVRVDLGPTTPDTAVAIQNDADRPLSIQVRPFAWSMKDGQDVLAPTQDILVAPSIVTIAPHARQIVRAALRVAPDISVEKTYRMHFTEIPQLDQGERRQVQMALNITIPLFVTPSSIQSTDVSPAWQATVAADGRIHLQMQNDSGWHRRLSELTVKPDQSDEVLFSQKNSFYVLPKSDRSWNFGSSNIAWQSLHISFENEEKHIDLTIPLKR